MSPADETVTEFERNARTVLEASLARIDARTRSKLNQARHARSPQRRVRAAPGGAA